MSTITRSPRTQTAIIGILLVGLLILSGFTWTLYDNLQNRGTALETKNAEIESLNQRISELSLLEELANVSKPPTHYSSGVEIVSSFPMKFDYNYPDTYQDKQSIIVLYIPLDGSIVSIDLLIDSISRYPSELTLQKGDAFRNQTWVKIRTTSATWDNATSSWEFWQAPVIWSMNVTESGLYYSPKLSGGWYTLSMIGPVIIRVENHLYTGPIIRDLKHVLHFDAKIDSYLVLVTVTVRSEGVPGFFAASRDWG